MSVKKTSTKPSRVEAAELRQRLVRFFGEADVSPHDSRDGHAVVIGTLASGRTAMIVNQANAAQR